MSLTYKDAGVDIASADAFVENVGAHAKSTHTEGVVPYRQEYASLFRPSFTDLRDPLIAATCDGVGTKLVVAKEMGWFEGLGQDLVAMNVNDLLPSGARPLFFLDYIATGKLDLVQMESVIKGIAQACRATGCALLGGETAEMPGLYAKGDFDLAGFAVGLVDGSQLPQPESVQEGDIVLALPSSGIHSNGLSLARTALLERGGLSLHETPALLDRPLGFELLEPTALYVNTVLALMEHCRVKTAAHITGGGLLGRAAKLVGEEHGVVIHPSAYQVHPIFRVIAEAGDVSPDAMARTFNMGLGYLVVLSPEDAHKAHSTFPGMWLSVGEVVKGSGGVDLGYAHT
jgi:phosphoribosylformylglycinamidine cyclo-ligase